MLLAILALALVAAVLVLPVAVRQVRRWRGHRRGEARLRSDRDAALALRDPGGERRAEVRARELLRSCVNDEEWAMYRDLGFIRVKGRLGRKPARGRWAGDPSAADEECEYAYLIYPHKPIVAFVPRTRQLLNEYCVEFPDLTAAISRSRLPDSDDVLAKWMALTGDERRLIRNANMHLPGRQVDPGRVRRDLWRLSEWERRRVRH